MEETIANNYSFEEIDILNFETIEPLLQALLERPIESKNDLEQWLQDVEKLKDQLDEKAWWVDLNNWKNTENEPYKKAVQIFWDEVNPKMELYYNQFDHKLMNCRFVDDLDQDQYFIYLRHIKNKLHLYKKENEELFAKTNLIANQYFEISGKSSVVIKDEELTLSQASNYLEYTDRSVRKEAYEKILECKIKNRKNLDDVFDQLVDFRHQIALNAGYLNFRDYTFKALGRFDYTPEDCLEFHQSIQEVLIPIINKIYDKRKRDLKYKQLKPYDLKVDTSGRKAPLKAYTNTRDFTDKMIQALGKVDPTFGDVLSKMDKKEFLDLESRKNKAPGGYCVLLPVSKTPFIFMNATGTLDNIRTLSHEAGHGVHDYYMLDLPAGSLKRYEIPSEIHEYPAKTMELLVLEHWDIFFSSEDDLRQAKSWFLESMITYYPWIALVDSFQHWLYLNPKHTASERGNKWIELFEKFNSPLVTYENYEVAKAIRWQDKLHIFQAPFFYIEYAMARLGSIATWKLYKTNPKQAIQNYKNAMCMGYTKTIPEVYKAAQIEFNFSKSYVQELFDFVYEAYLELQ